MIGNIKHRVYCVKEDKMYHFVKGYHNEGDSQIWTVYDSHIGYDKLERTIDFDRKELIIMPFIGRYDDTLWAELDSKEEIFWSNKGFAPHTFVGKEMYLGDILVTKCAGREETTKIIRVGHTHNLVSESGALSEISFNPNTCNQYIVGNIFQDSHLFAAKNNMARVDINIELHRPTPN